MRLENVQGFYQRGFTVISSWDCCYRTPRGEAFKIHYATLDWRHQRYLFRMGVSSYEWAKSWGCSRVVLWMGDQGHLSLPIADMDELSRFAHVTPDRRGEGQYEIIVTMPPRVLLKGYRGAADKDVSVCFSPHCPNSPTTYSTGIYPSPA